MWAVLVGIILAGMFDFLPRPTKENFLICGTGVVVGVAVAVYCLSWTHALLPHEHKTICEITEDTKVHYLVYVTQDEMETLHRAKGRGTASKGLMGSQGVRCFPPSKVKGYYGKYGHTDPRGMENDVQTYDGAKHRSPTYFSSTKKVVRA
jgi:hypothetical protein